MTPEQRKQRDNRDDSLLAWFWVIVWAFSTVFCVACYVAAPNRFWVVGAAWSLLWLIFSVWALRAVRIMNK